VAHTLEFYSVAYCLLMLTVMYFTLFDLNALQTVFRSVMSYDLCNRFVVL